MVREQAHLFLVSGHREKTTSEVITITPETDIKEAARILDEKRTKGFQPDWELSFFLSLLVGE